MGQIVMYILFFVIGLAVTFLIFNFRSKKLILSISDKIQALIRSFLNTDSKLDAALNVTPGNLTELGTMIDRIAELNPEPKQIPTTIPEKTSLNDESEKVKKLYDHLQIVNELGQRITASLSIKDVHGHLYKTINSMMDAAVFELGIYYWKDNQWQIMSNVEHTNDSNSEKYNNPMAEWCLKNNREILLEDAENEYGRYVFEPLTFPDSQIAKSVISFPIYQNEKERGALTVASFRKNAFNNYHIEMIRSLIPYVAVALDNALVHQELIVTQNQLIHNEKMASIGQLSSGIAHEILNPLNFVNNFSEISIELFDEFQKSKTSSDQEDLKVQLVGNLDKINFHGTRAYNIVKNMMQLTRSGDGQKTNVHINKVIEDTISIAYEGFKIKYKGFECRIEPLLDQNIPVKKMVAEDFTRVMVNVLSNAFYAMNDKLKKLDHLSKEDSVFSYEPELIVKSTIVNSLIRITIRDNGTGVPNEIKQKIFLPFFTTKPTGEGTGLGLSLSHDIITKGNNGEISVLSEPGKWTEFKIDIPIV